MEWTGFLKIDWPNPLQSGRQGQNGEAEEGREEKVCSRNKAK